MKKEFLEQLIKSIEKELRSPKSNITVEDRKKLNDIKSQLESDCSNVLKPETILSILQGMALLVEIMKEISPHLK